MDEKFKEGDLVICKSLLDNSNLTREIHFLFKVISSTNNSITAISSKYGECWELEAKYYRLATKEEIARVVAETMAG
jgi:hypothetical protein